MLTIARSDSKEKGVVRYVERNEAYQAAARNRDTANESILRGIYDNVDNRYRSEAQQYIRQADRVMDSPDAMLPKVQDAFMGNPQAEIMPDLTIGPNFPMDPDDMVHEQAFIRYTGDPRAKQYDQYSIDDMTGSASMWCCGGNVPKNVNFKMSGRTAKAQYYGAGMEIDWCELAEHDFSGMIDIIRLKQLAPLLLLRQLSKQLFFYGDDVAKIVGIRQLAVDRLILNTPLDQIDPATAFDEIVDTLKQFFYRQALNEFDESRIYTHAIFPKGIQLLWDTQPPTTANGCCTNLFEKLQNVMEGLKYKSHQYMNYVGDPKSGAAEAYSPAMLLYRRDKFFRAMPTSILALPPCEEKGQFCQTYIAKIGDVYTNDPSAGLLASNLLTGAC